MGEGEVVMGRPSKKTDQIRELIFSTLRQYPYKKIVRELAGISKGTLDNWLRDDPEFLAEYEKNLAIGKSDLIGRCKEKDSWKLLKAADSETFKDQYDIKQESTHALIVRSGDSETEIDI